MTQTSRNNKLNLSITIIKKVIQILHLWFNFYKYSAKIAYHPHLEFGWKWPRPRIILGEIKLILEHYCNTNATITGLIITLESSCLHSRTILGEIRFIFKQYSNTMLLSYCSCFLAPSYLASDQRMVILPK